MKHKAAEALKTLERYVELISSGRYDQKISIDDPDYKGLADKLASLAATMQESVQDVDSKVRHQTERLEQKRGSLEILYDVASTINESHDLQQLLTGTMRKLMGVVGAPAGAAKLLDENGETRLTRYVGIHDERAADREGSGLFGAFNGAAPQLVRKELGENESDDIRSLLSKDVKGVISIPLRYQDRTVGVYHLLTATPGVAATEEMQELLETVGKQLGFAIEKARLDAESKRLSIIEERNRLAHDLHDSLAQTLVSLRFQVRNLDQTLQQNGDYASIHEIERVEASIDEANSELRDLIAHFRSPMDKLGLYPALDRVIKRFKRDSGVDAYLQYDCDNENLSASQELQVMRIVQESLNNVKKHAQAHTVRVLVQCNNAEGYQVLIEDDGVGFEGPAPTDHPGTHIGLTVMKERAARLGGELVIESEPGDGTRVELNMPFSPDADDSLSSAPQNG